MKTNLSSLKKLLSKAQRIQRDNIGIMTIHVDICNSKRDKSLIWLNLIVFSNNNHEILCSVSPSIHNEREANDMLFNAFVEAVIRNGGKVK